MVWSNWYRSVHAKSWRLVSGLIVIYRNIWYSTPGDPWSIIIRIPVQQRILPGRYFNRILCWSELIDRFWVCIIGKQAVPNDRILWRRIVPKVNLNRLRREMKLLRWSQATWVVSIWSVIRNIGRDTWSITLQRSKIVSQTIILHYHSQGRR